MKLGINEILKLDIKNSSINKIDDFLASETRLSDDYIKAISYKAIIIHKLGNSKEAASLLLPLLKELRQMTPTAIISLSDSLIMICLDLNNFEQALKFINLKKTFLPMSKSHLYLKDMVNYNLKKNNLTEAKDTLIEYLKDDLSKDETMFAKRELAKIYSLSNNYEEYLDVTKDLFEYYKLNRMQDEEADLYIEYIKMAYKNKNDLKVTSLANTFFENFDDIRRSLIVASYMINSYINLCDLKKASIIESNYEAYATKEYKDEALLFLQAGKKLYQATNSAITVNEYEARIKDLEYSDKQKSNKKENKEEIEIVVPTIKVENKTVVTNDVLPQVITLNPEIKPQITQNVVKNKVVNYKSEYVSEIYYKLTKLIDYINQISLDEKFREIFRLAMIEIEKEFKISEAYILYNNRNYYGLHYKKERVYDKKIDFSKISKTLNYYSMEADSIGYLDEANKDYNINIVSLEEYPEKYFGISFPLYNNNEVIGSIAFFKDETLYEMELSFECLKLLSSIINSRLVLDFKLSTVKLNNSKLYYLKDNMTYGVKEEMDGFINLSSICANLLDTFETLELQDYYYKMKPNDELNYKNLHTEIYNDIDNKNPKKEYIIEYDFKVKDNYKRIEEKIYPLLDDGALYLLSIISDITNKNKEKQTLINLAYQNPISKQNTEVKLIDDLSTYVADKKLSLAVISVNDFNLFEEIYGYNPKNQLVLELGKGFKEAISEDFNVDLYHLGEDKYAILFKNTNDRRLIDSRLNYFFDRVIKYIKSKKSSIILELYFTAGVFRVGKATTIDNPASILVNALDALHEADRLYNKNVINHFDSQLHNQKFKDNYLMVLISQQLETNRTLLGYKQIVDVCNNKLHGYVLKHDFEFAHEFNEDLIKEIIIKKKLSGFVLMFTINKLLNEMKRFYNTFKVLINMYIEVFLDTDIDEKFIEYATTQAKLYNINPKYVSFIVNTSSNNKCINLLRKAGFGICSKNILDIYMNTSDSIFIDYKSMPKESIVEIHELCEKHKIINILNGIDNEEDKEFAKENNIRFVYGNLYKNVKQIDKVIETLSKKK